MYFPSRIIAGLISLLCSQALAAPAEIGKRDLNSFVASERAISLQGALDNIGPDGSKVPGAGAGFVVASPSKANPNCMYDLISRVKTCCTDPHRFLHMESRFRSNSEDAHR
jgi:glucoamylase